MRVEKSEIRIVRRYKCNSWRLDGGLLGMICFKEGFFREDFAAKGFLLDIKGA
jgi:hypothetical protein